MAACSHDATPDLDAGATDVSGDEAEDHAAGEDRPRDTGPPESGEVGDATDAPDDAALDGLDAPADKGAKDAGVDCVCPSAACSVGDKMCGGGGVQSCYAPGGCCGVWGAAVPCAARQMCTGYGASVACTCKAPLPECVGAPPPSDVCDATGARVTCLKDADMCPYAAPNPCSTYRHCEATDTGASCVCGTELLPTCDPENLGSYCVDANTRGLCALTPDGCYIQMGTVTCEAPKTCQGAPGAAVCK